MIDAVPDGAASERAKYTEIWRDVPEYKNWSPGLENVERFMKVVAPLRGDTLIDVGCGTGCAGLAFEKHGLRVSCLDITDQALDPAIDRTNFFQCPIWMFQRDCDARWHHGFCCDMMEHIPPEYSMLTAARIIEACEQTWFQISLVPDEFGRTIGQPLHLTVRPFTWWRDRLGHLGNLIEARDLCSSGLYIVRS